jgi:hypothetical protein
MSMELVLPKNKVLSIKQECQKLLRSEHPTVRELSRILGKMTASIQAIFLAPLHYRHLQSAKIKALTACGSYEAPVLLTPQAREELRWWIAHMQAWNGRGVLTPQPDLIIETDVSTKGWGTQCMGVRTGGIWSQAERLLHINCLELLAGAFAIKAFTAQEAIVHVKMKMDNRLT